MIYIAHRNGLWHRSSPKFAESTLRGYIYVTQIYSELGGIECDIHKTLDEQLVISHDPIVYIGGRYHMIRNSLYKDIQYYFCTLDNLLHSLRELPKVLYFIDIKEKDCESQLFPLLQKYDLLQDRRCHLVSMDPTIVQTCLKWKRQYPNAVLNIGQNFDVFEIPHKDLDFCSWNWKVYLRHYCSIKSIQKPHYVYTINSLIGKWIYQTIFKCDGIFTDRIHFFLQGTSF